MTPLGGGHRLQQLLDRHQLGHETLQVARERGAAPVQLLDHLVPAGGADRIDVPRVHRPVGGHDDVVDPRDEATDLGRVEPRSLAGTSTHS